MSHILLAEATTLEKQIELAEHISSQGHPEPK